jgi:hypothetical protein
VRLCEKVTGFPVAWHRIKALLWTNYSRRRRAAPLHQAEKATPGRISDVDQAINGAGGRAMCH